MSSYRHVYHKLIPVTPTHPQKTNTQNKRQQFRNANDKNLLYKHKCIKSILIGCDFILENLCILYLFHQDLQVIKNQNIMVII